MRTIQRDCVTQAHTSTTSVSYDRRMLACLQRLQQLHKSWIPGGPACFHQVWLSDLSISVRSRLRHVLMSHVAVRRDSDEGEGWMG